MDIQFATIGKDGKDDSGTSTTLLSLNSTPLEQAPQIEFATIGKDGKDDTHAVKASAALGAIPAENSPQIEL